MDGSGGGSEGRAAEMDDDGSASVDHQIEPAIVPGEGESFERVAAAHANAKQSETVGCNHFASNDGGTATENNVPALLKALLENDA